MSPWTLTHGVDSARHRTRTLTVTAAIGTAVLLAGCQADGVVAGSGSPPVDADAEPQLVDPDGLVEEHTFLLPAPDLEVLPYLDEPVDERVVVLDIDDDTSTRVVWTGLPCQIAPPVEVTGDPERLRITVDRGRRCWRKERRAATRRTFSSSISPSQRLRQPPPSTSASADRHPRSAGQRPHGLARHPTARRIMHTAPVTMNVPKARSCLAIGPTRYHPRVDQAVPAREHLWSDLSNRQCSQRPPIRSVRRNSASSCQIAYLSIVVSAVRSRS